MLMHSHRHRRLDRLLLFSLLQLLLDRPLVSVQPVELLKTYNRLQVSCIFLELSLDVGLQIGVDIVRTFADQPCIEDQQYRFFSLADEPKLREFFSLSFCISHWIQGKVINFLYLILYVVVGEEHSSCYLCDLDVSLPLVLDAHDSAIDYCELA